MKWLSFIVLALAGCKGDRPPPLTVEAYVWQAAEKADVAAAMERAAGIVATFHVRAAEMRWNETKFSTQRFISKLPSPGCGLVIRIGSSAASLEWTPDQIKPVADLFHELSLLGPSEIQCDFDCPQKRLTTYQILLTALRKATGKVPVYPTALPSWLGEPAFPKLIQDCGAYVLQVHSLQLPTNRTEPPLIFDAAGARTAVAKASALGVPFRVAMATYGCEVRFTPDGKVADVVSEDTGSIGPETSERAYAMADPLDSARLVREWTDKTPDHLLGIIWYRLPVKGDRRNWPWETLQLVARGEEDIANPLLSISPGAGARDVHVTNPGKFPLRLPGKIIITSPSDAADGTGAYRLEPGSDGLHFVLRPDVWPWLAPGKKIPAGWVRTRDENARIDWHIIP